MGRRSELVAGGLIMILGGWDEGKRTGRGQGLTLKIGGPGHSGRFQKSCLPVCPGPLFLVGEIYLVSLITMKPLLALRM